MKPNTNAAAPKKACSRSYDPTEYADLLFGVGSATSAGPTLPAGSIHPSPETLEKDCGGYSRNQPIVGFGHAYISGAGGVKCYGNFLLSPMLDAFTPEADRRASFAVEEEARCYEYRVKLENGIEASLAPAHHSAIHKIRYPADRRAILMLDLAHKLDSDACMKKGFVTLDTMRKTIRGGGLCTGNWNKQDWEMFFCLKVEESFESIGVFLGDERVLCTQQAPQTFELNEQKRFGIFADFGRSAKPRTLRTKLAISFVSAERAERFLEDEIPDFDYELVKQNACSRWREVLGAIEFQSADKALLRRLSTALYHANVQPRDRSADHGTWDDYHTLWDTWKTTFPLYSLLYPTKMGAIVDSLLDRAERNKKAGSEIVIGDEYSAGKEFLPGQGGNDCDNVICDAYLKGVVLAKHSWQEAYRVLLRSAKEMRTEEYLRQGYVTKKATALGLPYSYRLRPASATMGFALNDKAIARLAKELGTQEEAEHFEKRASNWKKVWNPQNESEGFVGFPQNREEDGTFAPDFDPHGGYNSHFYEATAWDASYTNYNDAAGLVEIMGGKEEFIRRLLWACEHSVNYYNDDNGKEGYLNFTNEPSFHVPWLFCTEEVKRPDLAAKVIDGILKRFSLENDYPGDEDNGGMSSFYLFLVSGFFPFATTENYYLHGTRLERIVWHLGNGKDLVITGENVGEKNIYVQSASRNGVPLHRARLTHAELSQGGNLHFVMGSEPSDWGQKE